MIGAPRYFGRRMWAARYWPKAGLTLVYSPWWGDANNYLGRRITT